METRFKEAQWISSAATNWIPRTRAACWAWWRPNWPRSGPTGPGRAEEESAKAPNRLDLQEALGNTAARTGKPDLAIYLFPEGGERPGQEPEARQAAIYMKIGEVYRRKGDWRTPSHPCRRPATRAREPGILTGLGHRAGFRRAAGPTPGRSTRAPKLDPNSGTALENLAFLLAEHGGDLNDALTKAQRAKQLMPNVAEVSDTLG